MKKLVGSQVRVGYPWPSSGSLPRHDGPLGILQPCACAAHRLGDGHHGLLLTDDAVVQGVLLSWRPPLLSQQMGFYRGLQWFYRGL